MRGKILVLFFCMLLIASGISAGKSIDIEKEKTGNLDETKLKKSISQSGTESNICIECKETHIDFSGTPNLDYVCMCEWVRGYDDHGSCKSQFDSGITVYFYGEVSNVNKGDLFSIKCLCNGDVTYQDEWNNPVSWSGKGAIWNWWTPSKDGTWKVKLYCNGEYVGSGPEFSIGHIDPFGKVKLEIFMQPYVPEEQRTVLGEYKITNVGDEGSSLNWAFTKHPTFGSNWNIVPNQGYGLKKGNIMMGTISFERPYAVGTYEGDFEVQNLLNLDDKDEWQYILTVVPKTCFAAGTNITMADGSIKKIENIVTGDSIMSYESKPWKVKIVTNHDGIVYNINNGLIRTTKCHPLYIRKQNGKEGLGALDPDKDAIRVKTKEFLKIELGDSLLSSNGKWIEIKDIKKDGVEIVYNILSFSGKRNYFANNLLVYEEFPKWNYLLSLVLNQEQPLQYLIYVVFQGKIKFLSF